jgi:lipopolysaccharide heptosyltransferase II
MNGAWDNAGNVLAVRLDALGDLLMTVPALRALKESRSGRRLTLLTSPTGAKAAALVPEIDHVIVYRAPWMKATPLRASAQLDRIMADRLRRQRFDAAAIFTVYSQNPLPAALLCYLADIPRRLAYCRENPYQLLTSWIPEREPAEITRHEVQRQLDLVAEVGCSTSDRRLSIEVPPLAALWAQRQLARRGLDRGARWLLVHPGASAPSRRYPPEQFAAAARSLMLEHGFRVLLSGARSDRAAVAEVQRALGGPCEALVGGMTVGQLAALLQAAPVVITNNTGPAHLAAAVGTPVVDLYALTNPQHTPWGVPSRVLSHDVPCKFCYKSVCPQGHHDCLRRVPPQAVVRAALELFEEGELKASGGTPSSAGMACTR